MTVMSQYTLEFLTIATVHLFAVASPGPDFAVVLKHSINYGRRVAIITSIGIAIGIFVHVTYSLIGIGLLIQTNPWVFNVLMMAATGYLLWLGISALRSSGVAIDSNGVDNVNNHVLSSRKAFSVGFITNGINPKATLFFLSVFAVGVASDTPLWVKGVYGIYMAIATGVWFCGLSYVLGSPSIRQFILNHGVWFDRVMGAVLILLALKLIITHMMSV